MEEYYFLSFDSTNYALQAEDYLKKNNFSITVMPTPREVSASCGLSIKLNTAGMQEVKDIAHSGKIKVKGIYKMTKGDKGREVKKVD